MGLIDGLCASCSPPNVVEVFGPFENLLDDLSIPKSFPPNIIKINRNIITRFIDDIGERFGEESLKEYSHDFSDESPQRDLSIEKILTK